MGGLLDWLGSKADETGSFLSGVASDVGLDELTPENIKGGLGVLKSGLDTAISIPGQGLDYLTSIAGSMFDPTKGEQGFIDYSRDPFSQMKLDPTGNVSVPTVGEQATKEIQQPFIKNLSRSAINIAANPASALITNPVAGAAMAPGMIQDTSKQLGTLWSELGDQGKSLSDPEVQSHLGELLPNALMTGAGIHSGFHEVGPLSEAIPEVKLGDYSSRSPIELKPIGWDERTKGSPSPVLGTSISEGGMKQIQPPDEAVTSVTDIKAPDEDAKVKEETSRPVTLGRQEIPEFLRIELTKAGINLDKLPDDVINNIVSGGKVDETTPVAPPKPINLGDAIDSLSKSLGWKPLGPDSRMVPPDSTKLSPPEEILKNIFTIQNPDWQKNPNELHQALLSEAERGDPAGQVKAYIDLISRKQPHRTGVKEEYVPPVKTEIPTRITQTDLATKQQALLDQLAEKDPEIRKIQESIISKPVSKTEESQPVESTGSVVSEDNESIVPGGRDTVKLIDQISNAQNKEEINKESAPGGLKEQTKLTDQISKAQNAEDIQKSKDVVRSDQENIKLQEKINKAQASEDLAKKSFALTLDNGSKHYVTARNAEGAKAFGQSILDRGTTGRKVVSAEPRLSSLEKEAQGISSKIPSNPEAPNHPLRNLLDEITNIPTTLKTLFHFSYPMRQGFFSLTRPEAWKGMKEGAKSFFSENVHKTIQDDLASRPNAENYKKFGLQQTNYETSPESRPEEFPSKLSQKIPLAKQSSRGFMDTGNLVRANEWDMWDKTFRKAGKTPETNPEDYTYMTKYLNDKTRRPELPDAFKAAATVANKLMFTPRGYVAKWKLFGRIGKLGLDAPPEMRTGVLRDLHGSLLIAGALTASAYAAAKAAGVEPETSLDPHSKMFGKVKVGHTTYDLYSGLGSFITDAVPFITGKKVSAKGNTYDTLPSGESVRGVIAGSHVRNQASPLAGAIWSALTGKNNIGQPETFERFLSDIGEPLATENIRKAGQSYGTTEALKNIPGFFGAHTEVELTPKEQEERKQSQPIMIPRKTSKKKSGYQSRYAF